MVTHRRWTRWLAVATALGMTVLAGCSTGQRSAPNPETVGEQKTLSITLDTTQGRAPELEAVANYLRQVGVNAEVRLWEKEALLEEVKKGSRVAYAQDWGSSTFDPYDLAVPKLKTGDRGNYSFYANPALDRLLTEGASGGSEEARREAYESAQQILLQDGPWIFGYYLDVIEATTGDVQGFTPSTDSRINLHDLSRSGADSLAVGLRTDRLQSLDPANHRDRETETVIRNLYDGLVTRTPSGEVVPELAESWSQRDPRTYLFQLKKGVRFHDGTEMTAEDVVFTFERILAPDGLDGKQSPRLGLLGPIEKVEKLGDYQVRFTLEHPFPVWPQLLVHTQIVSKAHVLKMGSSQKLSENPMGTGPFRFVRGRLDGEILLERFDDYYGGAAALEPVGPARLKSAAFRMIPEPATRVAALKKGELHIIQEVPVDQIGPLEREQAVKVHTTRGTRLYMIELNNKVLPDPRVRLALNHAIDWETILREIYGGRAHRVPTAMLPSGFGFNKELEPLAYDPEKARRLLREAGYQTR